MKTLCYKARGSEVYILNELLAELGYPIVVSDYFSKSTHDAVLDFQKKNNLVEDGIVGKKTWAKLQEKPNKLFPYADKSLSENDIKDFATKYDLELAVVKAVNEIECNGNGFLPDGRPCILFEGHIFWRELKKRNLDPKEFQNPYTENILYKQWTKRHYFGGKKEYNRLHKAAGLSELQEVHDAAFCAASYGAFQIMGFNYPILGYPNVDSYVAHMYTHERAHLEAFGLFCKANNLIQFLKDKDWRKFARGYNGPEYEQNKYHAKLENAYIKFKKKEVEV